MAIDIDKLIKIERAELGTTESPKNSNNVKYNTWYYGHAVSGSDYAWCCVFQSWALCQAGYAQYVYGGNKFASCTSLMNYHKTLGQVVTSGYQKGDLLLYQFDSDPYPDHIGLCTGVSGNYVTAIEGNTGTGNDANGGEVMERKRKASLVLCAVRWWKAVPPKYVPSNIKYIQKVLNHSYKQKLTVDGEFGTYTNKGLIRALQTEINKNYRKDISVDGIWGTETYSAMPNVNVCTKNELVRVIQMFFAAKYQELDMDGIFGTKTLACVKAFQNEHGLVANGVVNAATMAILVK